MIEKETDLIQAMLRDAHPAIEGTVRGAHSIHILGAGLNPDRPAHQAVHDLDGKGWRLVPIHPRDAGGAILGRPIRPRIEAGLSAEIVVFFLAPERAKQAVMELMIRYGQDNLPLLWFQPGSEHEDVLEMLNEAGILHIVDDCIVRFIQRHHMVSSHGHAASPWYLQVTSDDGSGCSVWTVESSLSTQPAPNTDLEWCGDKWDLQLSEHTVARYVRSLAQPDEAIQDLAIRLA